MGYLGGVLDAAVGDPEGVDGPVQVKGLLGLAERKALPQGGLVDLDDLDAGGLEVLHLVLDAEGDLVAGLEPGETAEEGHDSAQPERGGGFRAGGELSPGLVVPDERPVKDGDRAGEHALHGAVGHALGEAGPEDGHGLGAAHIAVDDRRLDAPRPVGLDPAVGRECEPGELLAKVLDHVVPLRD